MARTIPEDEPFVIAASIFFSSALFIVLLDIIFLQNCTMKINEFMLAGFVLGISGAAIRRYSMWILGKEYSIWLRTGQDQRLIKSGIYARLRHPVYLGTLVAAFSIPIFFNSLLGLILMLPLIPCYTYRMNKEEEMLLKRFGREYEECMSKTKRLIPGIY